mmetsp:Transcript_7808/g.35471  ORF Transcript_7808/g.35471 Transcript_7808/m.35471 type:complete len:222 (-) Transcript_7808:43-708(-)
MQPLCHSVPFRPTTLSAKYTVLLHFGHFGWFAPKAFGLNFAGFAAGSGSASGTSFFSSTPASNASTERAQAASFAMFCPRGNAILGLRGDAGGDANGDVNGGVFAGDFGGGSASVFVSFFGDLGGGAMFSVEEMFSNFAARTLVLGDLLVDTGGGVESTEFSRAIISNLAASSLAEGVLILAAGAVCSSVLERRFGTRVRWYLDLAVDACDGLDTRSMRYS